MMCTTCGCGGSEVKIEGHDHDEGNRRHRHGDESQPAHVHAPGMDGRRMVRIEQDILAKNQRHADANRRHLAERGIFALNLVSSPGSGKTTLLVRTVEALQHRLPVAVI
ncbi:MAG: hydrogenase accessory protein HypB, partial [Acidithiobacillus sp.]|nr:hydrogenase accessory protein HypB [Acidithiobacillus sp.]